MQPDGPARPVNGGDVATRFAHLSPGAARAVLVALLGLLAWAAVTALSVPTWPFAGIAIPDIAFYRHVVERVHAGQGYYDAAEAEFRAGGWRPHSMFNWRLPTYAWLLGALPGPQVGYWLLLLLAVLAVAAASQTLLRPHCGRAGMYAGMLLLMGGTFGWCFHEPGAYLTTEPWCEVLILLSLAAYARGWWPVGVATGAAALALRELALPYAVVAAGLAGWRGRRAEAVWWVAILPGYAVLLALHGREVAGRMPGHDAASVADWWGAGGLRFVLTSGTMNVFLRPLPPLLLAGYLPLALLGLAGWRGETGARLALSAGVYVAAFMVVRGGDYWGLLYAPVLVLGAVRVPAALRDLWAAAWPARARPAM